MGELKRERGDATMRPVWHALTSLVPVYATFRVHAHFRALSDLVRQKMPDLPDRAAWAAWIVSIAWVVGILSLVVPPQSVLGIALLIAGGALYVALAWQGQHDLNAYLRASGGEPLPRAHAWRSWGW